MHQRKINLGCGRNLKEGWINIDNSPSAIIAKVPALYRLLKRIGIVAANDAYGDWSRGILWRNVTRRLPFADGSVDKVYSSHMLEHLSRSDGERVISECYRVLQSGGVLRLVVPDLVFHVERYLGRVTASEGVGREPHDDLLFNLYGAYLSKKRKGAYHRYMYDWPTLRTVLKSVGFRDPVRQTYQVSLDPELAALDNRPEDSLHIDALKYTHLI